MLYFMPISYSLKCRLARITSHFCIHLVRLWYLLVFQVKTGTEAIFCRKQSFWSKMGVYGCFMWLVGKESKKVKTGQKSMLVNLRVRRTSWSASPFCLSWKQVLRSSVKVRRTFSIGDKRPVNEVKVNKSQKESATHLGAKSVHFSASYK